MEVSQKFLLLIVKPKDYFGFMENNCTVVKGE